MFIYLLFILKDIFETIFQMSNINCLNPYVYNYRHNITQNILMLATRSIENNIVLLGFY